MLEKLDKKFFEIAEKITLRGVHKSKNKEHKYHIQRKVFNWFVASFFASAFGFPIICVIFDFASVGRALTMLIWSVFTVLLWGEYQMIKRDTERHDIFWESRKNPIVYRGVKEALENLFDDEQMKKMRYQRLSLHFFSIGIFTLLNAVTILNIASLFMNIWLVAQCFYYIYDIYTVFIFDFDPPDKKEDKRDAKMTDLIMSQWKQMLGGVKA